MQNLLLISATLASLAPPTSQHNISGQFEGLRSDTVIVQSCDVGNIRRVSINPDLYLRQDTLVVRNGKLDIAWTVEGPTYFTIRPLQTNLPIEGGVRWFLEISNINFFLDKGENVALKVSARDSVTMDYTLTGSDLNRRWSDLRAQMLPNHIERIRLERSKDNASRQAQESIDLTAADLQRKLQTALSAYIRTNPGDPLSGFLLSKVPLDSAAIYLGTITPEVRTSIFEPVIDHVATRIEVRATRKQVKELIKTGTEAPDFTLKTIDGKDFTLSSLRGKYVVLDFWASWCGWCIKGIPELKKYYEKHTGKFEIVGITCNDKEPNWQKAVAGNALPWINVINPRESPAAQDLVIQYGIGGYPTKIILGPDGRIILVVVGENPDFYTTLDRLLE